MGFPVCVIWEGSDWSNGDDWGYGDETFEPEEAARRDWSYVGPLVRPSAPEITDAMVEAAVRTIFGEYDCCIEYRLRIRTALTAALNAAPREAEFRPETPRVLEEDALTDADSPTEPDTLALVARAVVVLIGRVDVYGQQGDELAAIAKMLGGA